MKSVNAGRSRSGQEGKWTAFPLTMCWSRVPYGSRVDAKPVERSVGFEIPKARAFRAFLLQIGDLSSLLLQEGIATGSRVTQLVLLMARWLDLLIPRTELKERYRDASRCCEAASVSSAAASARL